MWRSLAATATLTVALALPTSVLAQEASASQKSLPEQLVDAFNGGGYRVRSCNRTFSLPP